MSREGTKITTHVHRIGFPDGTIRTQPIELSFIAESDLWDEALDNAIEDLHRTIHDVFGTPPTAFIYAIKTIETIDVDDDDDEHDEEE